MQSVNKRNQSHKVSIFKPLLDKRNCAFLHQCNFFSSFFFQEIQNTLSYVMQHL